MDGSIFGLDSSDLDVFFTLLLVFGLDASISDFNSSNLDALSIFGPDASMDLDALLTLLLTFA